MIFAMINRKNITELIDQMTGENVHASNVVYLMAYHTFSNTFDEEDEVYQIDLTGSGEAYVFRDGVGIPARWIRTNQGSTPLIDDFNGAPIYFRPGITFYEVLARLLMWIRMQGNGISTTRPLEMRPVSSPGDKRRHASW